MYCSKCGAEINDNAVVCVKCGCAVEKRFDDLSGERKNWVVAYLLCWFLGGIGAHRFYLGKIGSGIAMLLTLGGCGIWSLIDFICMSFNNFTDADNRPLEGYLKVLGMIGFGIFVCGSVFYLFAIFMGIVGSAITT